MMVKRQTKNMVSLFHSVCVYTASAYVLLIELLRQEKVKIEVDLFIIFIYIHVNG